MTRYIGKQPAFGNFVKLDAISVVNGQAAYTMQSGSSNFTNYDNVNQFIVSLNGVIQAPTDSFTVSGSTITFASALSTGDVINFILVLGDVLSIGTPSDNTVSTAKIQNTAVNADKLATDAVQTAKIQDDAVTKSKTDFITDGSSAGVTVKGSGSDSGSIALNCSSNSHAIQLISPDHSAGQSYKLKLMDNNVTAGKFLKVKSITGSGATATGQLEFAEAGGGDLVKLFHNKLTSTASAQQINGYFDDTTYASYIIKGYNIGADATANLYFRVMVGGSAHTGSDYWTALQGNYNGAGTNGVQERADNDGANFAHLTATWELNNQATEKQFTEIQFFTPQNTSIYKIFQQWTWGNSHGSASNYHWHNQGIITVKTTSALTGVQIYPGSGNFIADSEFILYGVKK